MFTNDIFFKQLIDKYDYSCKKSYFPILLFCLAHRGFLKIRLNVSDDDEDVLFKLSHNQIIFDKSKELEEYLDAENVAICTSICKNEISEWSKVINFMWEDNGQQAKNPDLFSSYISYINPTSIPMVPVKFQT